MTINAAPIDTLDLATARRHIDAMPKTHFIGGRFVPDRFAEDAGRRTPVVNPADGQVLCEVSLGESSDVDEAVIAAAAALPGWRKTTPADRARMLFAVADAIDAHTELLARIETLNVGKPITVSRGEIPLASDALRFMAGAARTAHTPAPGEYAAGQFSYVQREPVGVVGAITPWNYPLMMAIWKIAPALAAGNTVVLKPSELTPLSTIVLAGLTADILPPGVLNVVIGTGPAVGEALTHHPGIGMVSLTGSVPSGKRVAAGSASSLKRVHLELGGKAPVVVFEDADLDEVAETIKVMGFWNSGQECGSATRILCESQVHDLLVQKIVAAVGRLDVDDPAAGDQVEVGPLISDAQVERVSSAVDEAVREGAVVAIGGSAIDRPGSYYLPTVITGVSRDSRIAREEVFGPVVTVERFVSESEAAEKANAVEYGLAASVWTENAGRALRMVDDLDFGTVWVNSHLTLASEMPWGGFGSSGYGRDMSTLALDDYTRTKHVMIAKRS